MPVIAFAMSKAVMPPPGPINHIIHIPAICQHGISRALYDVPVMWRRRRALTIHGCGGMPPVLFTKLLALPEYQLVPTLFQ